MRLVVFAVSGSARLGLMVDQALLDLNGFAAWQLRRRGYDIAAALNIAAQSMPSDLAQFLEQGERAWQQATVAVKEFAGLTEEDRASLRAEQILADPDRVSYLPPLAAGGTLFCVGKNYADHIAEAGVAWPELPEVFIRLHNGVVGHRQPVIRPKVSAAFDWENELAIVIGKHCRYVPKERALDYVSGYSIFNDGSLRDYQKSAPLLTAGKNFFHSGSLGPCIVSTDEVLDPQKLQIRTRLNGELMQDANTSTMVYDVATIISYLSEFTPLRPGDIIATGTPAGVGFKRKPPRFLQPGDHLELEIGNLGVLENHVVDEVADAIAPLLRRRQA